MNTPDETRLLVEEAAGAYRPTRDGGVGSHPAWHDLDAGAREQAFDIAVANRQLEAALDPQGLSTTAHAVMDRIRAAQR